MAILFSCQLRNHAHMCEITKGGE